MGQAKIVAKDEMISLLLPPLSVKKEYEDQIPAKYVFKCKDGVIQVPEYGILRSEFYFQQVKARQRHENDENVNVFDYTDFPKATVELLTHAFFGDMPKFEDNIEAIQLMHLLLFEGQASKAFGSIFEIKLFENTWNQLQGLMQSKPVCNRPHYQALVIIFFVSLDKPELVECAKKLANKETFVKDCFYMSWCLSLGKTFERVPEYGKMAAFLRQHCERKNWNITEWLKIQSKKVENLFKTKTESNATKADSSAIKAEPNN